MGNCQPDGVCHVRNTDKFSEVNAESLTSLPDVDLVIDEKRKDFME